MSGVPDYTLEDVLDFKFTTRQFSTGAPFAFASGAIEIYEDNSVAQITAAETLTLEFDGVTGLHNLRVDASTANGFENGKSYHCVVSAGTVDSVSVVGEVVQQFTIGRSAAAVDLANGTDGLGAIKSDTAAVLLDTAEIGTAGAGLTNINLPNQTMDITGSITGNLSGSVGSVTGAVGSVTADVGITATAVDNIWDEVLDGGTHNVTNSAGRRLRQIQENLGYEGGAVWIDTVNGVAGTENFENGTVENPVDNIADANTIAASLGLSMFTVISGSSITFAAAQNGQVFNGLNWTLALGGQQIVGTMIHGAMVSGTAAGVGTMQMFRNCTVDAVTHIKNTHLIGCAIAATQTVGEAGDYFFDQCHSAVAGTSTWTFEFGDAIGNTNLNMRHYSGGVQLESMGDTGTDTASIEGHGQIIEGTCTGGTVAVRGHFTVSGITNLTLSDDARYDSVQLVDDVWDEPLTAAVHNGATSSGRRLRLTSEIVQTESAVDDPGAAATTTVFNTDLNEVDDFWNDALLIFTSGALSGQSRPIEDYANTNGQITFDEPLTSAPANNVTFAIVSDHIHPITMIAGGVWDEALSGHTTAGSAGKSLADVETDTTEIGTAGAGLTNINLPNQTMDITGSLSGSVGSVTGAVGSVAGNVDGNVTGSVGSLAAQAVTDILTTQMTEAYNADGTAPTLAQALFMILQQAGEFSISGTTITVKKLDGSTTAATFTLDDGSDPTSRTRAT